VTINVQIADLDRDGYGVSPQSLPRAINAKRLSKLAARGLAHMQVAMMAQNVQLASRERFTGKPTGRPVLSREDCIVKLLEMVGEKANYVFKFEDEKK